MSQDEGREQDIRAWIEDVIRMARAKTDSTGGPQLTVAELTDYALTSTVIDRLRAPTTEPSEPVAWMIAYGCGCEIPCTTKVAGTWCPKHDEDGPVVETRALVYAHPVPEDFENVERKANPWDTREHRGVEDFR